MELFNFLLFLAGLIAILWILDRLLKKWFAIDPEVLESATAKKIKSWGKWAMVAVLLMLSPVMSQDGDAYVFWLILFLTILTIVEAFFEWRLLKGTRVYQMTLTSYALAVLAILIMVSVW